MQKNLVLPATKQSCLFKVFSASYKVEGQLWTKTLDNDTRGGASAQLTTQSHGNKLDGEGWRLV